MKGEFSRDRLQKSRYRFVVATNGFTGVAFVVIGWIMWPHSRATSMAFLAMGLIILLIAGLVWRHGAAKSRIKHP